MTVSTQRVLELLKEAGYKVSQFRTQIFVHATSNTESRWLKITNGTVSKDAVLFFLKAKGKGHLLE